MYLIISTVIAIAIPESVLPIRAPALQIAIAKTIARTIDRATTIAKTIYKAITITLTITEPFSQMFQHNYSYPRNGFANQGSSFKDNNKIIRIIKITAKLILYELQKILEALNKS